MYAYQMLITKTLKIFHIYAVYKAVVLISSRKKKTTKGHTQMQKILKKKHNGGKLNERLKNWTKYKWKKETNLILSALSRFLKQKMEKKKEIIDNKKFFNNLTKESLFKFPAQL